MAKKKQKKFCAKANRLPSRLEKNNIEQLYDVEVADSQYYSLEEDHELSIELHKCGRIVCKIVITPNDLPSQDVPS